MTIHSFFKTAAIGVIALTFWLLLSNCSSQSTASPLSIVPMPNELTQGTGVFKVTSQSVFVCSDDLLQPAVVMLKQDLAHDFGLELDASTGTSSSTIRFELLPEQYAEEGYELVVSAEEMLIKTSTYRGAVRAIQTIRQLAQPGVKNKLSELSFPTLMINDAPHYAWRGLMLDVSRHFYNKEEVMRLLDNMAYYKLNKFHWHLTDDQGWRIEIKKYPKLTSVGAWRKLNKQDRECLARAKKTGNPDMLLEENKCHVVGSDTIYGGFYTQEDIKEVVAYAATLGIDIIPEIDMPGHSLAAVENYKGVSCFDTTTSWEHSFTSPICPGKQSALDFCKNVYSEVFELFPYKYVHLGADEVNKTNWNKCPDCQRRMRKEHLKDAHELQAWFVHYMEHFFNQNGKRLIGWDEILAGGLSPTATITWWRSWVPKSVPSATAQGNDAILCPNSGFYFDYAEKANTLEKLYTTDFVPQELDSLQRSHVLGMQANIWCEYIPTVARVDYMIFPRALGVAEKGWTAVENQSWDSFAARLPRQFSNLSRLGINYHIPPLTGFSQENVFVSTGQVVFKTMDPSASIHYTLDGTDPTLSSPLYTHPFEVKQTTSIKVATFHENGHRGDIIQTIYRKTGYTDAVKVSTEGLKAGLKCQKYAFTGSRCAEIGTGKDRLPLSETVLSEASFKRVEQGSNGYIMTGYVSIPEDGIYTFDVLSDDGSIVRLDDKATIDNDGMHSPESRSAQFALRKGLHTLSIRYFDYSGGSFRLAISDNEGKMYSDEGLYYYSE